MDNNMNEYENGNGYNNHGNGNDPNGSHNQGDHNQQPKRPNTFFLL